MRAEAKVYPQSANNRLTLLENPRSAALTKLDMVRKAKHHIHIITYFWDDSQFPEKLSEELVKANERGVEVRILTTFIPSIATDIFGKSKKRLKAKNENVVFNYFRLKPVDGLVFSNNLHEKIFLIDGEKAILGGRNISDSSFRGKDMEILLEGPVVNQVQDHFLIMHDFLLEMEIKSQCQDDVTVCLAATQEIEQTRFFNDDATYFPEQPEFENGVEARILTHEAILKQHQNVYNIKQRIKMEDDIMNAVLNTQFKKLRAYNYFVIPTPAYKAYLEKNLKLGNEIQMITNSQRSASFVSNKGYLYSLPEMRDLARKGLSIFQWNGDGELAYLHEKVMIFDDEHVIVGSHNFGIGSTSVSNEIAIEFKSPEIAARLIEVFDEEISNSKLTKRAKENTLLSEIKDKLTWIKVLRTGVIGDILQELY